MSKDTGYISRTDQLDALDFNREIHSLLLTRLLNSLHDVLPEAHTKFAPEIKFLVRTIFWAGSVGKRFSSFGQDLLLLRYGNDVTRLKLILHYLGSVCLLYAKEVVEQRWTSRRQSIQKALEYMENLILVLSLVNFFRFMKTGTSPTILDYLLQIKYIPTAEYKNRQISYHHVTRELLWTGFMEVLGFTLPLINYKRIYRTCKRFLFQIKSTEDEQKSPEFTVDTTCSCCEKRPVIPHHIGCGHVFCFYCIHAAIGNDPGFLCPDCSRAPLFVKLLVVEDVKG